MSEETKRGFWWWFTWIVTPLGIFAGPVGIASMLEGIIEWHGPIGYFVNLWSEIVRGPFGAVFDRLASVLKLPELLSWQIDYLAFGVLFASSQLRANLFIGRSQLPDTLLDLVFLLLVPLLWPLTFFLSLLLGRPRRLEELPDPPTRQYRTTFSQKERWEYLRRKMRRDRLQQSYFAWYLTFAPFALFPVLWVTNIFLS